MDSRNNTHRGEKARTSLPGIHTEERTNISSGGQIMEEGHTEGFHSEVELIQ